ncbi:MAG: hypothetical protein ABJO01_01100 [Parasphingorhabdus sp.]|uniref:hypothetical protein n=1 Tax=Parasphingorhabdus sp. TaxID=2709688 RepID=UPI003299F314
MRKKITYVSAIFVMLNATAAQAQQNQKCISPETAQSFITYVLPGALDAVRKQCANNLPADAAILQLDSPQLEKYQTDSEKAWPKASVAIRSMIGDRLPAEMDMDAFRPFVDAMVPAFLSQEIKTSDCPTINKVYRLLEPLPTVNLASLTVMLAQLGGKDEENSSDKSPFNICKTPSE